MKSIIKPIGCFITAATLLSCTSNTPTKPPMDYSLLAEQYTTRLTASDPNTWQPPLCPVSVPTGGITVSPNGLFHKALDRNAAYLLNTFSNDHILYPFRKRAGMENPPDDRPQVGFWDTDLRGANAGRFMMGAGNTLRWLDNPELRTRLNLLIDGIEECREENGYILPYPHVIDSLRSEEPNYARAWLTHGLIDAAIAGNPKAYPLLRGHADYFNKWDELHPKLIHWEHNSHQGHIASTRTYLSPIGKPEDLQVAEKFYVCDWWMDELSARHDSAVWQYPLENPHSYLITSFEAYLDHYLATGDKAFLNTALGAWDIIRDKFEHIGGSIAICESQWVVENGRRELKNYDKRDKNGHPPYSYSLTGKGHTGETCGSAFWIKLNQRLHCLYPHEEKYVAEIEKSIYNVILAAQTNEGNIRYHANMEGQREHPTNGWNTCCEGQGTRLLGSIPEYIYSIPSDGNGLYVNLYEASTIKWQTGDGQEARLTQATGFPYSPEVELKLDLPSPKKLKLHIRIPSWAAQNVDIYINDKKVASGKPGTYLVLDRKWTGSEQITFTLPMQLRSHLYTGVDTIPGLKRYAVEYGPVLLASISNWPELNPFVDAANLQPDNTAPLHFISASDPSQRLIPYWELDRERFYVYPAAGPIDNSFIFENNLTSGFEAEFFNNEKWEGKPAWKGTVPSINYNVEREKPIAPNVPVDRFSSRFTGEFTSPFTGTLVFLISTDDGYHFYVDGKEISQSARHTDNTPVYCNVDVLKGQTYRLKLEHTQSGDWYRIILKAFHLK
jgi:DUF1680 family protein